MPSIPTRLLLHRVTIQRMTRTHDGQGGHTETFVNLATDVPARISPAPPTERQIGDREEGIFTHKIYFRPDQDIVRSDRVVGVDGQDYASHTFDVVGVQAPSKRHHLEVLVKEFIHGG